MGDRLGVFLRAVIDLIAGTNLEVLAAEEVALPLHVRGDLVFGRTSRAVVIADLGAGERASHNRAQRHDFGRARGPATMRRLRIIAFGITVNRTGDVTRGPFIPRQLAEEVEAAGIQIGNSPRYSRRLCLSASRTHSRAVATFLDGPVLVLQVGFVP